MKEFIDHRVMGANEAMAGIFGFDVHRSSPPVMPLRVHLEDEQLAVFEDGEAEAAVKRIKQVIAHSDGIPMGIKTACHNINWEQ